MKYVAIILAAIALANAAIAADRVSVCGPCQQRMQQPTPAPTKHAPAMPQLDWTPEPIGDQGKGTIILTVPVSAVVEINNHPTISTGSKRVYQSSNLLVGEDYRYRIRVTDKGREIQREVFLHANETKTVDGHHEDRMATSR
jgi:hypothetical protein